MPKKKKKIRKRKRRFDLSTEEGKQLSLMNQKLFDAFPKEADRKAYLQACIKELDRLIEIEESKDIIPEK